jgi:hypothetical protein
MASAIGMALGLTSTLIRDLFPCVVDVTTLDRMLNLAGQKPPNIRKLDRCESSEEMASANARMLVCKAMPKPVRPVPNLYGLRIAVNLVG